MDVGWNARPPGRLPATLALVAAMVAGASASPAQPARDEPRARFETGLAALDEQRFAEAAAAFERSYELRPVPVVLYNLGLAYRGMGRYRSTLEAFERYLRAPPPAARPTDLAALRVEMSRLQRALVHVEAHVEPAGATIRIDGRPESPVDGVLVLDPGPHVVELSAEDHRPERIELRLEPGTTRDLAVRLQRVEAGARLHVTSTVPGAEVAVDGRVAGRGEVDLRLPPGTHRIEVRAPGYRPWVHAADLGASGVVRLDATLEREPGRSHGVLIGVLVGAGGLVAGAIVLGAVLSQGTGAPFEPALGNYREP